MLGAGSKPLSGAFWATHVVAPAGAAKMTRHAATAAQASSTQRSSLIVMRSPSRRSARAPSGAAVTLVRPAPRVKLRWGASR